MLPRPVGCPWRAPPVGRWAEWDTTYTPTPTIPKDRCGGLMEARSRPAGSGSNRRGPRNFPLVLPHKPNGTRIFSSQTSMELAADRPGEGATDSRNCHPRCPNHRPVPRKEDLASSAHTHSNWECLPVACRICRPGLAAPSIGSRWGTPRSRHRWGCRRSRCMDERWACKYLRNRLCSNTHHTCMRCRHRGYCCPGLRRRLPFLPYPTRHLFHGHRCLPKQ